VNTDLTNASVVERYKAEAACSVPEAHIEHMAINGDCPWCGCYDKSKWLQEEEL